MELVKNEAKGLADEGSGTSPTLFNSKADVPFDAFRQLHAECGVSRREFDVIAGVCNAGTNKKIADTLCVCEKTVKFHLTNIYKKVGVKNRLELFQRLAPLLAAHNTSDSKPAQATTAPAGLLPVGNA